MNANNPDRSKKAQNLRNEFHEYGRFDRADIDENDYTQKRKQNNYNNANNFNAQKYQQQEECNVKRVATTLTQAGNLAPRKRQSKLPIMQNEVKEKEILSQKQEEVQKTEEQFQMIRQSEFNSDEIVENIMDDNTILSELNEFKGENQSVAITFAYSQNVKQIQLYKFTMKIECPSCQKIFITETLLYKNTKAPAVKQRHCDSLISIYFIQNHNQKIKDQHQNTLSIGYLDSSNSKFEIIEAILIIICNCSNRMQVHLWLDILDKEKQILACLESYRSLCKVCCKELIVQTPLIHLQIMKDQNKKN